MRVLQAHNAYRQAGGEDSVVAAEAGLLRDHGDEVRLFGADNAEIGGPWSQLTTAWRATYSVPARRRLERLLAEWRPDVVHVHNLFPLLTASVLDACRVFGVPSVMTLHNFRLICPGALLCRHGKVCEVCVGTSPWRAILHRCYRGSLFGSMASARMVEYHRKRDTWQSKVDRFIVMSEFARQRFVASGWAAEKVLVKPHFCRPPELDGKDAVRHGAFFAGRLSPEKGVRTLLSAWKQISQPLKLAGDGPLRSEVEAACGSRAIQPLGWLTSRQLSEQMRNSVCLVVPSGCYETFGMVVIEAFSHGLPVVAARIGALPELVEDGVNGLLFEPGNAEDLAAKARRLLDNPREAARMGESARATYRAKYTPERNYPQLRSIYQEVIDGKKSGSRPRD